MRIYLVRHGRALSKEKDPERGLSDEGKQEVERVAALLGRLGTEVEAVWESGKKRATQTAGILASALKARGGIVRQGGMDPNDPVRPVAERLASLSGDYMLVGHLPFMSSLASLFVLGREEPDIVRFAAGGVACLEQDEEDRWVISWVVDPVLL
jgi:phosphohistidine phosphatase